MELYFLVPGIHHTDSKDSRKDYKGKRLRPSLEGPMCRLLMFLLPRGSHRSQSSLSNRNAAACVQGFCSGKLTGDSVAEDFTGGGSHRHPPPGTYQNPRHPGKQVY